MRSKSPIEFQRPVTSFVNYYASKTPDRVQPYHSRTISNDIQQILYFFSPTYQKSSTKTTTKASSIHRPISPTLDIKSQNQQTYENRTVDQFRSLVQQKNDEINSLRNEIGRIQNIQKEQLNQISSLHHQLNQYKYQDERKGTSQFEDLTKQKLLQQFDAYKSESQEYINKMSLLSLEKDQVIADYNKAMREIEMLKLRLSEKDHESRVYKERFEDSKQMKEASLKSEKMSLELQIRQSNQKCLELEMKCVNWETDCQRLKYLIQGLTQENEQLKYRCQAYSQENQQILIEKDRMKSTYSSLEIEYQSRLEEIAKNMEIQKTAAVEKEMLLAKKEWQQARFQLLRENQTLQSQVSQLDSQATQLKQEADKLQIICQDQETEIQRFQQSEYNIQNRNQKQINELQQQFLKERQDCEELLFQKSNSIEELQQQLQKEKQDNKELLQQKSKFIEQLQQQLLKEKQDYETLLQQKSKFIEQLQQQLLKEKQDYEAFIQEQQEANSIVVTENEANIEKLKELDKIKQQSLDFQNEINALKQKIIELEELLRQREDQIQQLEEELGEMNNEIEDLLALKDQYERLQLDQKDWEVKFQAEQMTLETQIQQFRQKNIDLEEKLSHLKNENHKLEQLSSQRMKEIEQWKFQFQETMVKLEDYEELRVKFENSQNECLDLQQERLRILGEKSALDQEVTRFQNDLNGKNREVSEAYELLNKRRQDQEEKSKEVYSSSKFQYLIRTNLAGRRQSSYLRLQNNMRQT